MNKRITGSRIYYKLTTNDNHFLIGEVDFVNKGFKWFPESETFAYDLTNTSNADAPVLINTSTTNYKGGDFYMFLNGGPKKIKEFSEPGDVLIFKSYFFHKIEPVTKGERKSLSLFLSGPRLV